MTENLKKTGIFLVATIVTAIITTVIRERIFPAICRQGLCGLA